MHHILEIALGVGLGMTLFLVILWILGTCVYICCGKTKKIATVRKLKVYPGLNQKLDEKEITSDEKEITSEEKEITSDEKEIKSD